MLGILVHIILLLQGIPPLPNTSGTVTGVLTTDAGRPAVGVRVAVMEQPVSLADVTVAAALVSIGETDDAGRFRLENVPTGRYYISAGRVEMPTFFPGTLEIAAGRIITVAAGATVADVNFRLKDVSDRGVETINAVLRIPLRIQMNEARLPIFSDVGKVRLRLTHLPDGKRTDYSIDEPSVTLPIAAGEYEVGVDNLPNDVTLNELRFGSTNLRNARLKVSLADLPDPDAGELVTLTDTQTGIIIQRRLQGPAASSTSGVSYGSITSKSELTLSISANSVRDTPAYGVSGVKVSGKVFPGQEEAYISGKPGRLYADGTFEFRNVTPGRHIVFTLGRSATSRQLSALINVGNVDVDNLQLQDTITLPLDVMSPAANQAGLQVEGSNASLHTMKGHVVSEATRLPVAGIVTMLGFNRSITYSLPADGEFEIPDLLPGSYGLKIETFDRATLTRTIVVGDKDVELSLVVPSVPQNEK